VSTINTQDKLEDIGFYTLSDERAKNISQHSNMSRGEIILTDRCNFKCAYCRGMRQDCRGDMPPKMACKVVKFWTDDNLFAIRFSGGEPTLYPGLSLLARMATRQGVKHRAVSTNGSAEWSVYDKLLKAGVNDFSVSLDACCASYGDKMAGLSGHFDRVTENIKKMAARVYTTVGVVLNEDNEDTVKDIVAFAHDLGVADIRVVPSAQHNQLADAVKEIDDKFMEDHPILKYRSARFCNGINVRGIPDDGPSRCPLVQDDSAVAGQWHFPCIIYMREQGDPIGIIGPDMRQERALWAKSHDIQGDPICKKNCLDVCIAFNEKALDERKI